MKQRIGKGNEEYLSRALPHIETYILHRKKVYGIDLVARYGIPATVIAVRLKQSLKIKITQYDSYIADNYIFEPKE